jgi:hypothetical protein
MNPKTWKERGQIGSAYGTKARTPDKLRDTKAKDVIKNLRKQIAETSAMMLFNNCVLPLMILSN